MNENSIDWLQRHRTFKKSLPKDRLQHLETEWNVAAAWLRQLGIGWWEHHHSYTFPERDHKGRVIGILRRDAKTGQKRTIQGSKRGIYLIPKWRERPGPILIPEGVSDTATLLAHGLSAIGRPSSKGGAKILANLLQDIEREIIVIGENDQKSDGGWPGRDGAQDVAQELADRLKRDIQWALPPDGSKDVREYFQGGRHGT